MPNKVPTYEEYMSGGDGTPSTPSPTPSPKPKTTTPTYGPKPTGKVKTYEEMMEGEAPKEKPTPKRVQTYEEQMSGKPYYQTPKRDTTPTRTTDPYGFMMSEDIPEKIQMEEQYPITPLSDPYGFMMSEGSYEIISREPTYKWYKRFDTSQAPRHEYPEFVPTVSALPRREEVYDPVDPFAPIPLRMRGAIQLGGERPDLYPTPTPEQMIYPYVPAKPVFSTIERWLGKGERKISKFIEEGYPEDIAKQLFLGPPTKEEPTSWGLGRVPKVEVSDISSFEVQAPKETRYVPGKVFAQTLALTPIATAGFYVSTAKYGLAGVGEATTGKGVSRALMTSPIAPLVPMAPPLALASGKVKLPTETAGAIALGGLMAYEGFVSMRPEERQEFALGLATAIGLGYVGAKGITKVRTRAKTPSQIAELMRAEQSKALLEDLAWEQRYMLKGKGEIGRLPTKGMLDVPYGEEYLLTEIPDSRFKIPKEYVGPKEPIWTEKALSQLEKATKDYYKRLPRREYVKGGLVKGGKDVLPKKVVSQLETATKKYKESLDLLPKKEYVKGGIPDSFISDKPITGFIEVRTATGQVLIQKVKQVPKQRWGSWEEVFAEFKVFDEKAKKFGFKIKRVPAGTKLPLERPIGEYRPQDIIVTKKPEIVKTFLVPVIPSIGIAKTVSKVVERQKMPTATPGSLALLEKMEALEYGVGVGPLSKARDFSIGRLGEDVGLGLGVGASDTTERMDVSRRVKVEQTYIHKQLQKQIPRQLQVPKPIVTTKPKIPEPIRPIQLTPEKEIEIPIISSIPITTTTTVTDVVEEPEYPTIGIPEVPTLVVPRIPPFVPEEPKPPKRRPPPEQPPSRLLPVPPRISFGKGKKKKKGGLDWGLGTVKRRKDIFPLADYLSVTLTEFKTGKKATHQFPTFEVKKEFERVRRAKPFTFTFPTVEMLGGKKGKKKGKKLRLI